MQRKPINQMEELLAAESSEEWVGWRLGGWHYSTNCGNGSKVELSGPDGCMEIDPTVTLPGLHDPPDFRPLCNKSSMYAPVCFHIVWAS